MEISLLALALLALCVAPVGLLSALGVVMLLLKITAIVQKASEPPTEDQHGDYRLEQSREVGKSDTPDT